MFPTDGPLDEGAANLLGSGQVLQFFQDPHRRSMMHHQLAVESAVNRCTRFVECPPVGEPRGTNARLERACEGYPTSIDGLFMVSHCARLTGTFVFPGIATRSVRGASDDQGAGGVGVPKSRCNPVLATANGLRGARLSGPPFGLSMGRHCGLPSESRHRTERLKGQMFQYWTTLI